MKEARTIPERNKHEGNPYHQFRIVHGVQKLLTSMFCSTHKDIQSKEGKDSDFEE